MASTLTRSILGRGELQGFVYLMECDGIYKIGRSEAVAFRLSTIRSAMKKSPTFSNFNPDNLRLVHEIPTGNMSASERMMHHLFRAKSVGGGELREWFRLSADDVAWICGIVEL